MNKRNTCSTRLSLSDDIVYKKLCVEMACLQSLDELGQFVHSQVKMLGFSDFMFVRLQRCWTDASQKGLLSSLPSEWLQSYQNDKLHEVDLAFSYGRVNVEPIFSSEIYEYIDRAPFDLPLIDDNRRIVQLYRRWGYADHYLVPAAACNGQGHVLLVLTSVNVTPTEFRAKAISEMSACRSLCRAIDSVSTQQFCASFIPYHDQSLAVTVH